MTDRRPSKVEFEVTLEDQNGDEHEFTVRCTITPGCDGYTSGAPEDCYPAEPPEVQDLELLRFARRNHVTGKNIYDVVPESEYEKYGVDYEWLENLAVEKANEAAEAAAQDYEERERD